jgi:hypothetical protein
VPVKVDSAYLTFVGWYLAESLQPSNAQKAGRFLEHKRQIRTVSKYREVVPVYMGYPKAQNDHRIEQWNVLIVGDVVRMPTAVVPQLRTIVSSGGMMW